MYICMYMNFSDALHICVVIIIACYYIYSSASYSIHRFAFLLIQIQSSIIPNILFCQCTVVDDKYETKNTSVLIMLSILYGIMCHKQNVVNCIILLFDSS